MGKKALICGISGQDGAYLAQLLLKAGIQFVAPPGMPKCHLLESETFGNQGTGKTRINGTK